MTTAGVMIVLSFIKYPGPLPSDGFSGYRPPVSTAIRLPTVTCSMPPFLDLVSFSMYSKGDFKRPLAHVADSAEPAAYFKSRSEYLWRTDGLCAEGD
jgi:hypothetical protein